MRRQLVARVLLLALLSASCRPAFAADATTAVDFNRDVRPILSKICSACHGPDEAHREAGLRLDRREAAVAELESGSTAIVPGHADQSELIARITTDDESIRMPPPDSGRVLAADQIELLRRWVEQGAPYAEHWSFVQPVRAPLPRMGSDWPGNEIDHFVLARLEQAGLKPSPEADRYSLARRLSFDLRGLPPTLAEVDEFVADSQPLAYERLVDRFLADPAYGERWARMWLDQARYADSAGYGSDPLRTIWRYRDWVIDAFNRNLPFDRFTIEQIAGDLLPDHSPEQLLATAFHRNTMTNTEGGTDDEEFRVAAIRDRVDTTFQVWMGLTMGCAKCHNHKYDPITQREYYQFYDFFNQTADTDLPDERPTVQAPTAEIDNQIRRTNAQIAELKSQLAAPNIDLAGPQAKWESELRQPPQWTVLKPAAARSESGAALTVQEDGSVLVSGPIPDTDAYTILAEADAQGSTAVRLEALPHESLPGGGAGRASDGSFVLSQFTVSQATAESTKPLAAGRFVRIELSGESKLLSLAEVQIFSGKENIALAGMATQSSTDFQGEAARAIDGNTNGHYFDAQSTTHTRLEANPWWDVDLGRARQLDRIVLWNRTDGRLQARLAGCRVLVLDESRATISKHEVTKYPDPSAELDLAGGKSIPLSLAAADVTRDGFSAAAVLNQKDVASGGWSLPPGQTQPQSIVFVLGGNGDKSAAGDDESGNRLSIRIEHRYQKPQYVLGRFRLSVTADRRIKERASVPAAIIALIDAPSAERTPEQQTQVTDYYRSIAPALQPIRDQIAKLEKSRPAIPTLPVMQELHPSERRESRIMVKGDFLTKGDAVEAAVPEAFHRWPQDAPRTRLGVALWLVDSSNPLTARVAVNRYWAQLFGTGLVETEEDFGTQGELPTHPELLDWLATEYIRLGWDTKALLRLIVTSRTYRQSSRVTPERLERDPRNRLFSRGPRFRLEAEMVRDQSLALCGLLSGKIGGASVYPPQPPGLWQAAFNGQRTWATSSGEDRFRRGLYTFWRRTIPYPSMATFDAPSRELCAVRRIRTNTPLQAFVTMNDPVYVEAAQALARRIVSEGGVSAEERAAFALRLCLARPAHERQIADLVSLYKSETEHYRADAKAAKAMATDPLGPLPEGTDASELAAWTVVANILLNMDAVLTKG